MIRLLTQILAFYPTRIPVGLTDFNAWLDAIVDLTGPIADAPSLKWVICNEVMRLSPGRDRISKRSIAKLLRKYAANQLAAHTVNVLKAEQDAQRAAELAAQKQSEDTPLTDKPSGEKN